MLNEQGKQLFRSIDRNVRMGTVALNRTLLDAKSQVARGREDTSEATTRVAYLLLAAQYESRLNWLIWHPSSRLTDPERQRCLRGGVASRWETILKTALASRVRASSVRAAGGEATGSPADLPEQYRAFYYGLRRISREYLNPLIDNRNSLAHGEWDIALNKTGDGLNHLRTFSIFDITLYRVVVLANLLEHYWKCNFDALVTKEAFERDYVAHQRRMGYAANRLIKGDEDAWKRNLRKRFQGGRSSHGGLSQPPQSSVLGYRILADGFDGPPDWSDRL